MASATERKFTSLRKRLDQLGYRQPLGLESLPLVERLFGDLLHTTESLKSAKCGLSKTKEQKGLWEQQVEPYRHDNARLCQENIDLHKQLLDLKEMSEARVKELKAVLRRYEHENSDLKFLNSQYMQRLLAQEKESEAKSEKIQELQEKNLQAVIQTPGGRKKHIPFRRQRMEIDSLLPESSSKAVKSSSPLPSPDPYIADLLKVADNKITSLTNKITDLEKDKKQLMDSIQDQRKQIERREAEIDRLAGELKGGRTPDALAAEGKRENNERFVAHLNIQIDYLQQANEELQSKVVGLETTNSSLTAQVNELSDKNLHVCEELEAISGLMQQMENEKKSNEEALSSELLTWKEKYQMEVEKTKELEKKEKRYEEVRHDNQRMAELLATSQIDSTTAIEVIERLSKDNERLKLQLKETGGATVGGANVARLHKEKDALVNTIKNFEIELMEIQEDLKSLTQDRDNYKLLYEQVNQELNNSRVTTHGSTTAQLLCRVENERDDARLEVQQLRSECHSLRERLKIAKESKEREREEDQSKVTTLQVELETVCQEREDLQNRVASLRDMVHKMEDELKQSNTTLTSSDKITAQLRNKVKQLQGLVEAGERTRLEQDRDLKQHMSSTELAKADVARLQARISNLENELSLKNGKEQELTHTLTMLDKEHDSLRNERDLQDEKLSQLVTDLEDKVLQIDNLQETIKSLQVAEAKYSTETVCKTEEVVQLQTQLARAGDALQQNEREKTMLEQYVSQLKDDLATMTQENQSLHGVVNKVREELEVSRRKVDDYSNKVAQFKQQLAVKEQEKVNLLDSYHALSDEAQRLDSTIQQSQSLHSTTELELSTLRQENTHLKELNHQQKMEIEQHVATVQAYELQLSNLTRSLSKMEQLLRQEQEEKKALVADLTSVRELCSQIELNKESLTRQLASLTLSSDQLKEQLSDLQTERDVLKQQAADGREKVENLEKLLAHERRKEFESEAANQETTAEIQRLKEQLTRLENDGSVQRSQVVKLQGELAVQLQNVERLKTELATEKFQKQHIQQQINRLRAAITSPHSPSPSLTSSSQATPNQPSQTTPNASPIPKTSAEIDKMILEEQESMQSLSAKVVDQLVTKQQNKQ